MTDATPEQWRAIPGFEGLYEASDQGRVYSVRRPRVKGGLMRPGIANGGYPSVTLCRGGRSEHWKVHQIVMLAFAGPCPPGMEVRHLDGDPANNRWAPGNEEETQAAGGNLFYGTRAENVADMLRHGTHYWANRTHCENNHEFTPENTAIELHPDGRFKKRRCLACHRENGDKWRAKNAVSGKRCSEDGCDRAASAYGLCHTHRDGQLRPLRAERRKNGPRCSRDGCDEPQLCKNLCSKHYLRQNRADRKARVGRASD